MKNLINIFFAIMMIAILSSCGMSYSTISNHNQNNTQVNLSESNFKIVDKINGSTEVTYFLIFGGMKDKKQYETAYSTMLNKANLMNSSRAIINVVTEEHLGGFFPIYYTRTITVSAHVIEFTK